MKAKKVMPLMAGIVSSFIFTSCSGNTLQSGSSASSGTPFLEPQFNQDVTCTSLSIGNNPAQDITFTVTSAYLVEDIHSLPAENFEDDLFAEMEDLDSLPPSEFNFAEGEAVRFLCIDQTVKNDLSSEVSFSTGNQRVLVLDSSTGEAVESDVIYSEPIYIDANGKNDASEVARGIRPHLFNVTLAPNEACNITVGYAVTDTALEKPLAYSLNPFGREESAAQQLVLGYVE